MNNPEIDDGQQNMKKGTYQFEKNSLSFRNEVNLGEMSGAPCGSYMIP